MNALRGLAELSSLGVGQTVDLYQYYGGGTCGANVSEASKTVPVGQGVKLCSDPYKSGCDVIRVCVDNCDHRWRQVWNSGTQRWDGDKPADFGDCGSAGPSGSSGPSGLPGGSSFVPTPVRPTQPAYIPHDQTFMPPPFVLPPNPIPDGLDIPSGYEKCDEWIPKFQGSTEYTRYCYKRNKRGKLLRKKQKAKVDAFHELKVSYLKGLGCAPGSNCCDKCRGGVHGLGDPVPNSSAVEPYVWLGLSALALYAVTRKKK